MNKIEREHFISHWLLTHIADEDPKLTSFFNRQTPVQFHFIRLWLCTLALLALTQAHCQVLPAPGSGAIEFSGVSSGRIDIGTRMLSLVDPSGQLQYADVMQTGRTWQPISRPSPNFGFTNDAHWFRFQLVNPTESRVACFIELPIPFINEVLLFHSVGDVLAARYELGDLKPFDQRAISHPNFIMPLQLAPGANTIIVRLASSGTIEASFRVWDPVRFQEASNNESLLQGGLAGIMLIMIAYNLFVYFSTRDLNYIYYVGFVANYLLFHFTLNGYSFAYIWPQSTQWNSFAISTFMASTSLFACLFANAFLRLRQFSRKAYLTVNGMTAAYAVLLVATFLLPYSLTVRIGAAVVVPLSLVLLALGYWRWWHGATFARFYCLAWTAALVGVSVLNLGKLGLIPSNFWTNNADQAGLTLLITLLSFTLADRINHDRVLRQNAQAVALAHERQARASQQALIHAAEQANRELEMRVNERTLELNAAMDQLSAANDRLQLLSITDGLTQISNRAFFDNALSLEHRRAVRLQSSLALIMFDIDHFKHINDTYGHLGGDACLRSLASLLQPRIHRAGDVLARYGGEEFVILLMDTVLENALALAELLRADVEAMVVVFEGRSIQFSASFGVACAVPSQDHSAQDYLAAADSALYSAKNAGRNCVRAGTFDRDHPAG